MDFKLCSGSLAICRSHPLFTFALLQSFVGISLNQFFLLPVKFLCHKHLMDPAILGPETQKYAKGLGLKLFLQSF